MGAGFFTWLLRPGLVRGLCEPVFRFRGLRRVTPSSVTGASSILVVRLDEIGDFVMTTPLLRELRRNAPHAQIVLVVRPPVVNLAERCPYVNRVLAYAPPNARPVYLRRLWHSARFAWHALRPLRPDLALLPRWAPDLAGTVFVAYFSGAAGRIGWSERLSESHQRENRGYDGLLTNALSDWTGARHEVTSSLELLRRLGGTVEDERLELWLDTGDEAWAKAFLDRFGNGSGARWVALGLGSRMPRKSWPLDRYAELAAELQRDRRFRTLAVLGPGEESLADQWRRATGGGTVAQGQSLRQTAALLKRCALFVGNDSGPKHLAAAMGIPVVEVNASPLDADPLHPNTTSPVRFGPWGVQTRSVGPQTLQAPCRGACTADAAHCILGVRVEDVTTAVAALAEEQERRFHL